jgi:G:T/U-mismatch repair DNA glycosylase
MSKLLTLIALALGLTGCATADFSKAVDANAGNYKNYSDGQIAQQQTLQACFQFNPDKSQCAILAAGTNAVQTLAGRPEKIREPATNGELATGLAKDIVTGAVVYGIAQQASGAVQRGQDNSASVASQGIEAASKPPLVVDKPVIVTVPAGAAVLPVE